MDQKIKTRMHITIFDNLVAALQNPWYILLGGSNFFFFNDICKKEKEDKLVISSYEWLTFKVWF